MEINKISTPGICISNEITQLFPDVVIGWLRAVILNTGNDPKLDMLLQEQVILIQKTLDDEKIRRIEEINAGKRAYRHLGKDPNRYRLSAEALMRRVVRGKELYRISPAVDTLNLVSLRTGVTIGGFDFAKIVGNIQLGIGSPGEEFEAIGRGPLNVENLPVYRDREGAIGNPTSDSIRTQISGSTSNVLMLITGFYGKEGIQPALYQLSDLLLQHCSAEDCQTGIITGMLA
jgi:DNA/RNA-binding domain of Phe-tRNA-synthetase-like protein